MTSTITRTSGRATTATSAKLTLSVRHMMMPITKKIGARTNMRSTDMTKSWRVVMSFVRRVTREPVVNLSVCSRERDITLLKASTRMSLPKPCDAMEAV